MMESDMPTIIEAQYADPKRSMIFAMDGCGNYYGCVLPTGHPDVVSFVAHGGKILDYPRWKFRRPTLIETEDFVHTELGE